MAGICRACRHHDAGVAVCFLLQSGYIGVCAVNVRPGDVVCILSDIKVPFILRPKVESRLSP